LLWFPPGAAEQSDAADMPKVSRPLQEQGSRHFYHAADLSVSTPGSRLTSRRHVTRQFSAARRALRLTFNAGDAEMPRFAEGPLIAALHSSFSSRSTIHVAFGAHGASMLALVGGRRDNILQPMCTPPRCQGVLTSKDLTSRRRSSNPGTNASTGAADRCDWRPGITRGRPAMRDVIGLLPRDRIE
jgi:hypothetical protein